MKIISYNVNGIRAALKKGFDQWLKDTNPDVVCLQEIKANPDQFDVTVFENLGYYHYWYPAQKKGYSGVAILTKIKPNHIEYGIDNEYFDNEGRNIRIDLDSISIMSMYLPSASNIDRLEFKYQYMEAVQTYVNTLKETHPNLLICGDYNICHEAIDIHDPIRNAKVSGFLPEERAWISQFIKNGFIDTFREFNTEPHQYSWWTYRANARNNNKGWRIDYLMASDNLKERLSRGFILSEAKHSDHCPVGIELH